MEPIQTPEEGTELEIETPQTQTEQTDETPNETVEAEGQTTEQAPQATPDYKQKFVDSQREAILLAERNKLKEARLEQLTKTDTPTDEAMRQVYPEWDEFNQVTKTALIKTEAQEMRQRRIEARQQELDDRLKLEDEIENALDNPKFNKLKGREAEFKRFALNPKNRGINSEVLAQAFLYDADDAASTATAAPAPAPQANRGEALPSGSGGPRGDTTPKKTTLEEARNIRKTDYKRYMELVKTNQIEDI